MRFLLVVLFFVASGFAAGDTAKSNASTAANVPADSVEILQANPEQPNIPLPRQTSYTGRGLSVGIGAGMYYPTEDCDCMGVWQGQLEYFYTSFISGGADVRFLGGNLDSDVMVMYQRYRLNIRVHKAFESLDLFVEPFLGFESTSISEFREQAKSRNSSIGRDGWWSPQGPISEDSVEISRESCEKMFSLDGFSFGVGGGAGYVLNRYLGLTGSVLLEYNFSRAMQLTLTPGIAFNLQRIWPWSRRNLRSSWLSLEFGSQRFFNRGVDEWANSFFVGVQIGM